LRAAGETETTQEHIQDWLKLGERGAILKMYAEMSMGFDVKVSHFCPILAKLGMFKQI
jgi:alkanesulfonate monooxygenase SsuD/methylene tetrahydromethanopterin reductase-like flavin-dependent oxidoreductase (luciferase family)